MCPCAPGQGLERILTKAEAKLFTLADMGELQHLAPFLAFAFAIPATTCKSNQEVGLTGVLSNHHTPACPPFTSSSIHVVLLDTHAKGSQDENQKEQ